MFDVYIKEIRSILEFAVPVWHSGLTRKQALDGNRENTKIGTENNPTRKLSGL